MSSVSGRDVAKCAGWVLIAKAYALFVLWVLFVRTDLRSGDLGFVFQRIGQARSTRVEEVRESFVHRLTPYDGQWYQDIALRGYRKLTKVELANRELPPGNYAFFPFLPGVLYAVGLALPNYTVAVTLALTIVLSVAGACLLWRIARALDMPGGAAVILLLAYPAAVFQLVLYTEGMFLCLSAASLWFTMRERLEPAAAFAFLAGLCRPQGVLLALPLFFAFVWPRLRGEEKNIPAALGNALLAAVPISGFIAMAAIAWSVSGSPTGFMGIQTSWGRAYGAGGFFEALTSVVSYRGPTADIIGFAFGVGLLPWVVKRLPLPLAAYGVGMVVLPLLTGSILSFGRFMSVSVPHFLVLAALLEKRTVVRRVLVGGFIVLQVLVANGLVGWYFVG